MLGVTCLGILERNEVEHNLKWELEKEVIIFIHLWDLVGLFSFQWLLFSMLDVLFGSFWNPLTLIISIILHLKLNILSSFSGTSIISSFCVPNSYVYNICWFLFIVIYFLTWCCSGIGLFMGISYALSCEYL